jgi:hypothetical protein
VAVPNQALPAVIGALVGMFSKKAGYFGFNSLSKQRSRAVAQNIGQSIGESPRLNQSKNVSVGHGVSLLRWRSGGVKHPHDTPPYPFMPSPTFANNSGAADPVHFSVTKWFYDLSWSGINIEPHLRFFEALQRSRSRDINLNCGAGRASGECLFHKISPVPELWSFDAAVLTAAITRDEMIVDRVVSILTLDEIIDLVCRRTID